ncbi:molybdopterin-dependent oxidoreductase [Adlercreutzia sp. R21]|uniref:molybdopterin-containing oxidoreductase family protein n=1 Tax=Adlercreutzia wanghongyangiae TaxID=3111451 RepID=UPI002DB8B25E|nr:molybdopterin-dependent oxidoreductase [Adlercreutzia sp. R21]MEC4185272.1 molybdopterin-dependent oxidoreductase [Adlercreutzia sp. R21]
MSLLDKSLKRRDFLKASAAAMAATAAVGAAGCAPQAGTDMAATGDSAAHPVASDAAIIEGKGEWMPIHCHQNCNQMCLNMGYVVDGVVIRQKTDDSHADSFDCPQQRSCLRGHSLRQQVYNADRIKYPMKRKMWQPGGGDAAHGELRGRDEWERISWDEALTYVTDELKRVYAEYGEKGVICNSWRWAPGAAMFPVLGGAIYDSEVESFGTWAFQTEALGLYSWGDHPDIMMAPDKYDLPNADTIVLYGCNPAWCHHSSMYWLHNAKNSGTDFVYVGPNYNESAASLDARWIRVRPGTDTAFLLAVVYEMIRLEEERGDIIDWDFVNERTVGFTPETMPADAKLDENFRDYVLGVYDGTPKTPEWATEICGTPVEDITWYAEMAGKNNAVIFLHSYAASRYLGAENLPQAFMTVSALGGHYGKSGHGSAAIYTWDAGDSGYRIIQHAGGDYGYIDNLVGSPAATGDGKNIEGPAWWRSLLDGKYITTSVGPFDLGSSDAVGDPTKLRANTPTYHAAQEMEVNPRLLIATNSNFMQTRGDLNTAIKVMRQADTCISFEIKMSLTAQFADILLPVITHWEGNDDESWGELAWPSPFGDGNGQKQRKDALLAWKPLIKPMYECRDEKMVFREIMERMGANPDDAYPKSNYDQWLGYFLGMRVLNEGATKWEPVITWTDADNEKYHASYPAQEGKVGFDQFMADGCYVVQRSEGDKRNYVGYRDDKLGIGEDGESVVVADTAWPRPSVSGKLEIYCQFKADNVNATGLNPEPIKPYANYFTPRRGYQETFANWETKERAAYPLQAFTPHYLRRAHSCYDNMTWTQEAFRNPVFMSVEDAEARGIEAGDTVMCYNDFGRMLRIAQPMQAMMPGTVAIPHGPHSVFDETDPDNIIDRGGSEQMLSDSTLSNYFPHLNGYNSLLIEVEKYDGEPLVEDFDRGPFLAAGVDGADTPAYVTEADYEGQEA